MGRDWNGDEAAAIPEALWAYRLQRALTGRRGQKALRELEAALLLVPDHELGLEAIARNGQVCALGALGVLGRLRMGQTRESSLAEFEEDYDPDDTDLVVSAQFGKDECGLAWTLAWTIAQVNDHDDGAETPAERWTRVLAWVRSHLVAPSRQVST